jgi:hypothetical protein
VRIYEAAGLGRPLVSSRPIFSPHLFAPSFLPAPRCHPEPSEYPYVLIYEARPISGGRWSPLAPLFYLVLVAILVLHCHSSPPRVPQRIPQRPPKTTMLLAASFWLALLSLAVLATSGHSHHGALFNRRHSRAHLSTRLESTRNFTLVDRYQGKSFFE